MLWAATHVLPAPPKTSQGRAPPLELPLDEPDPLELPEELVLPEEPEPPELELPEPGLPEEPELELLVVPPLPELLPAPELLLLSPPPLLPEDVLVPPELLPELPVEGLPGPDENDPHATATAPSDTATDTSAPERIFFMATSSVCKGRLHKERGGFFTPATRSPVK